MSFLIDPPLLYGSGRAYGALTSEAPESRRDVLLGVATMTAFWGISVSLYLEREWTRPIWRLCRARSGRDWMLNSGLFGLDHLRPGRATHALATAIFLSYPYWLWRGFRSGRHR